MVGIKTQVNGMKTRMANVITTRTTDAIKTRTLMQTWMWRWRLRKRSQEV
jgi:hypothetical protein